MNKSKCFPLVTFGFILGGMVNTQLALADHPDLGAQWWQFMSSIPAAENPLSDTTGEKCAVGQRGDMWFLGGVFAISGTVTRECTIPKGKRLFVPVLNVVGFNTPGICGQGPDNLSVDDLVSANTPLIDAIGPSDMAVTLNGHRMHRITRIKSSPFEISLPESSIWDKLCMDYDLGHVPAGVYSPGYQDGYYVTLDNLRTGTHTLQIQATLATYDPPFVLDVTYHLKIVPVSLK